MTKQNFARTWVSLVSLLLMACAPSGAPPENAANADKVAVVITGWGEPKGFSHPYRLEVNRARIGKKRDYPYQACTEMFAGHWPYSSQIGLLPYAVAYPFPLLKAAYDSFGIYRWDAGADRYISIVDDSVRLKKADIPAVEGIIKPVSQFRGFPARSINGIDPRDGTNYLKDVFMIGAGSRERGPNPLALPNGLSDAVEIGMAASMADMGFMYEDWTPRPNEMDDRMTEVTVENLKHLFGDQVDVAFGAYAETPGVYRTEEQVAVDFVEQGYRKLVLTRETTDNNHYANQFMTRGIIAHELCNQGWLDDVEIQQTLQVGRTPEYNTMLLEILRPHMAMLPEGEAAALIYTTYGMPFPGGNSRGPFGVSHPLAKDVYHENAYFNYQSFKRYAQAEFGERLIFNQGDARGDKRTDSYYAYAMFPSEFYGAPDDPLRFPTIRETIDQAKRDGRGEIIVLLSHWNYTNTDNLLGMRKLNQIPYNSREDVANGKTWIDWCELLGESTPVSCDTEGAHHIQFSEVFDKQAEAFGIGYAQRIRGAIERFGVMPRDLGIEVVARGAISARDGGSVAITNGELAGAELVVPADPAPGKPEQFEFDAYEAFVDPAQPFIGAWFDFEAYIATQPVDLEALPGIARSPAVLFGPYRTLVNKPARVSLPVNVDSVGNPSRLRAYIYNEVSHGWDPVFTVAGGAAPTIAQGRFSFDTQVLGLFVVLEQPSL